MSSFYQHNHSEHLKTKNRAVSNEDPCSHFPPTKHESAHGPENNVYCVQHKPRKPELQIQDWKCQAKKRQQFTDTCIHQGTIKEETSTIRPTFPQTKTCWCGTATCRLLLIPSIMFTYGTRPRQGSDAACGMYPTHKMQNNATIRHACVCSPD